MPTHNQILTLARAGNPVRAWALFCDGGLDKLATDIKALTLKGRLLKDLAGRADRGERVRLLTEAAEAYFAAHALKTDTYPLINAATLALLAGDPQRAATLAREVLDLIEADPDEGETVYWREATRSEALLLLGHMGEAEAALADGITKLPHAWEDHAATIGQFERIIAVQGWDAAWLDTYRPAASVHFSGLIGLDPADPALHGRIAAFVANLRPGFAFGALAAGADILLAEALLEAGAELHVTLPVARDEFRAISVEPSGGDWAARYDLLLEQAETVHELWSGSGADRAEFASLIESASLVSMGQAMRHAGVLRSKTVAVTMAAPDEQIRPHVEAWEHSGLPLHTIKAARSPTSQNSTSRHASSAPNGLLLLAGDAEGGFGQAHGLIQTNINGETHFTGQWRGCVAAVHALRDAHKETAMALVVDNQANGADRARLLAQAAGSAHFAADFAAAMIAKVLMPETRVEEVGEVASPAGPMPIYAIAPEEA
ncbi:MAG: tetratricopeptide repeat-containing protein [Pseudomonadota bacterium]